MQGLIGKKVGMTRMFEKDTGKAVAVTVIQAANNVVHQVKTMENDGYSAVQLGFDPIRRKEGDETDYRSLQEARHHARPALSRNLRSTRRTRKVLPGSSVGVEMFENVKLVDVIGISKGRGFAGTIKRHHFMRGRECHGNRLCASTGRSVPILFRRMCGRVCACPAIWETDG